MSAKQRLSEFYTAISDDLDRSAGFWLQHSLDKECGGYFQCLETDGTVYDTNKYCWLLSRQVFTYARLYNEMTRFRLPNVLEAATKGAEFIMKYVKDPATNKCYFSLTREGKPTKDQRQIYSECFYTMAMAEMYRATKEETYKKEAVTMMKQVIHWARVDPSGLGYKLPPPTPTSTLALPMVLLMVVDSLRQMEPNHDLGFTELTEWCVGQALKHVQRSGTAVLDNVSENGSELPGSVGRQMCPGIAIETGWLLLQTADKYKKEDLKRAALETFITASFVEGWDSEFGGIFFSMDVDGRPPLKVDWDMKHWWPHCEAMVAMLMAYKHTGDEEFLNKFAKVFDYVYQHFVDTKHGEWFGYLSREGKVKINAKGGEWKGCFHVPRSLMMCEQLLHEILQSA